MSLECVKVDGLDRLLVHGLQLDGRLPFARFAQLVGVSEQTVARRYRRLLALGIVRVIGLVDPAAVGESTWMVRIRVRPGSALQLAEALARRPDVSWVSLTSGGSEIFCSIHSRTSQLRDELLLKRLPGTAQVIDVHAHALLHRFDQPAAWTPGPEQLDEEARAELLAQALGGGVQSADARPVPAEASGVSGASAGVELTVQDESMLAELADDGRVPVVRLAAVTGWTPARVNRRLEELVSAGLLYFDTEIAVEAVGFKAQAMIWLTVGPAQLRAVGEALAGMAEVTFAAATTGPTNLAASTACLDNAHLFRFVTERLGTVPGIQGMEISPYLRQFKQAGTMVDHERLVVGPARTSIRPPGRAPVTS